MSTNNRIVVSYPYGGFKDVESFENHFVQILKIANEEDSENCPIVVFNMDTDKREQCQDKYGNILEGSYLNNYLNDNKRMKCKVVRMISSDTCIMWLRGWEEVIKWAKNKKKNMEDIRVVLLPGDIQIEEEIPQHSFLERLRDFCMLSNPQVHIFVGDYDVESDSAKELIDKQGTYPFLAHWFPRFYEVLIKKQLRRPRSEFLNIKLETLYDYIIGPRKFAYEETIKILLECWSNDQEFQKFDLGPVEDEKGFRALLGVMEQIERMERMIRQLWRDYINNEISTVYRDIETTLQKLRKVRPEKIGYVGTDLNGWIRSSGMLIENGLTDEMIVDIYENLDTKSSTIRQNSMNSIKVLLDWKKEMSPQT